MRALVDLLVPPSCDGCGVPSRPPWCDDCRAAASALRPDDPCRRCAGPGSPGHACWSPDAPVARTAALSRWHDPVARVVLHAKLAGRTEVLRALGRELGEHLAGGHDAPDAVVPVPSDRRRVRRRGADHTRALGEGLATALGVPVVRALRLAGPVPDRGRSDAPDRAVLPPGSVLPTASAGRLAGRRVLVVDDLVTTGATLAACARALRVAGVADVAAAVVARAGAHPLDG